MRTRSAILPVVLTVAFSLFMPSFWMIDVFQSQTPSAMIVASAQVSSSDTAIDTSLSTVADEGDDEMGPFAPLMPPHAPLSSTTAIAALILPPPHSPTRRNYAPQDSLPASISQEVPTTPPLHQA